MSIDVCEGCRRLRKRCDKDDCVLQPCLESLWRNNKLYQGNATVFLAKYFGRKRFFELLQDVTKDERPALFKSLLHEACGRTVNPVSGAIGLKTASKWHLCEEAVINVLTGGSLNQVGGMASDGPCISTTSSSCPFLVMKAKRERDDEDDSDFNRLPQLVAESRRRRQQNLNLDLNLSLQQQF
ncbi:unnamed protein product [Calypogeia fissa]